MLSPYLKHLPLLTVRFYFIYTTQLAHQSHPQVGAEGGLYVLSCSDHTAKWSYLHARFDGLCVIVLTLLNLQAKTETARHKFIMWFSHVTRYTSLNTRASICFTVQQSLNNAGLELWCMEL